MLLDNQWVTKEIKEEDIWRQMKMETTIQQQKQF